MTAATGRSATRSTASDVGRSVPHVVGTAEQVIVQLDAQREIALVRARIADWLGQVDDELREPLEWTFKGTQKHFRPLTLFACHRAVHGTADTTGDRGAGLRGRAGAQHVVDHRRHPR